MSGSFREQTHCPAGIEMLEGGTDRAQRDDAPGQRYDPEAVESEIDRPVVSEEVTQAEEPDPVPERRCHHEGVQERVMVRGNDVGWSREGLRRRGDLETPGDPSQASGKRRDHRPGKIAPPGPT